MPESYSVGSAFLQVVPSFKGIAETINARFREFGRSAGSEFSNAFNGTVESRTAGADLGPSEAESANKGATAGGKFADAFRARVDAALKALPDAQIDADSTDADRKLAELRAQIVELSGKTIGVDIADEEALAKIKTLEAQLDTLARRSPNIHVKVDAAAASAELAAISAQAAATGGSGKGGLPSGAVSGGALAAAAVGAVALAGPVGGAAAALIAGTASAIGALAAGAVTAYLGLSNVSSAMQLLGKRSSATGPELDRINAKLAAMGPATVAFAGFVQNNVMPAVNQLKATASGALLPGLQSAISTLLSHAPALNKFVGTLAGTLGSLATSAARALGNSTWTSFFNYISASAGPILTTLGGIVGNVAQAFARFIVAFGPVTKQIGAAVLSWTQSLTRGNGLQQFVAFVQKSGPIIAQMIGSWIKVIGQLVVAFAPLGVVIAQILGWVGKLLSGLGGNGMLAVIAAVSVAVVALALPFAAVVGPIVGVVAAIIGLSALAALIIGNWGPISRFFVRLWNDVTGAFTAAWDWIESTAESVAARLMSAWSAVKRFFTGIGSAIASALSTAIGAVSSVVGSIVGFFTALPGRIGSAIAGLGGTVGSAFASVVETIGSALASAASAVGGFITSLPGRIGAALASAGSALLNLGKTIAGWFLDGLKAVFVDAPKAFYSWVVNSGGLIGIGQRISKTLLDGLVAGAQAVWGFFTDLPGRILGFLTTAGTWLLDTGKALLDGAWNGIVTGAEAVWTFFMGLQSKIAGFLVTAGTWLSDTGKAIITGAWNGITTAAVAVWNFFTGLQAKILGYLKSAGTWLVSTGKSILAGIGDGVATGAVAVWNFFTNLPGKLLGFVKSAGTWLISAGKSISSGILDGISSGAAAVWIWIRDLPSKLGNAMKGAENWLLGIGKQIIQGLINGIERAATAVWDAVKDAVSTAVDKVKNFLGIHSPSRVFAEIGMNIAAGMAQGIAGSADLVSDAARNLAPPAVNAVTTIPAAMFTPIAPLPAYLGSLTADIGSIRAAQPAGDLIGAGAESLAALRELGADYKQLIVEFKRLPDRLVTSARNAGVPIAPIGAF